MTVSEELEAIADAHDGILRPADVVWYAKDNPDSELYSKFEWDADRAAALYRLEMARRIIRVYIKVLKPEAAPTRVFVSLESDRQMGIGYRRTIDVMSSPTQRTELLEQALKDFHIWRRRYESLVELGKIFEAAEEVSSEHSTQSVSEKAVIHAGV